MSKRHTAELMDMRGNEFTLDIYDTEHTGSVHTLTLTGDGFTIEWDGDTDKTHPQIIGSRCTMHLLNLDSDTSNLLDDLSTASEGRFRIEVHRKPAGGTVGLYWSGVILTDMEREDRAFEFADIEATDDLANLDGVQYRNDSSDYTDQVTLPVLISRVLGGLRHLDAWTSSAALFAVTDHLQHEDHTGAPYLEKIIVNSLKLRNLDADGQPQYHTARELLEWITVMLSAVVYQCDGLFIIEAATRRADTTKTLETYTKSGGNVGPVSTGTHGLNVAATGTTIKYTTNLDEQNRTRLAGWSTRQLPPLREVIAEHKYDGFAPDWSGLVPGTNFAGTYWDANQAENLSTGAVVTLVFTYYLNIGPDGTNTSAARRLRGSLGYRHGTIYAKRDSAPAQDSDGNTIQQEYNTAGGELACFAYDNEAPAYSSTSSNRVQWFTDVFDKKTGGILTGTVAVTFPSISGTPGTTQVGFLNWETFNANGTSAGPLSGSAGNGLGAIYQMHGSAVLDGDDVLFTRTNGDANARESQDLGTALLADKLNDINNSTSLATWAVNPGGDYVPSDPEWSSTTFTGVSTAALDLACLEVLALRTTATELVRGRMEADGAVLIQPLPSSDNPASGTVVLTRLVHYGAPAQFEVEGYVHRLELNTGGEGDDTDGDGFTNARAIPGSNVGDTVPRRVRANVNGQLITLVQRLEEVERQRIAELKKAADTRATADDVDGRVTTLEGLAQVSTLDDLTDVDAPAEGTTDGDVLKYNSSAGEWEARALDPIPTATSDLTNDSGFVTSNLASGDQTISAGTTRKIVLSGGGGQQVFLNVEDGQGNTLESIVAYGNGVVIQEKFGALAIRSTTIFQGSVALYEAAGNGINSISIKAPAAVSSNKTFTLPDSYGTSGQALTTNGSGTLAWATVGGSGGGVDVLPLANVSGRYTWSSADDGERVHTGNTSYGVFNFYNFVSEPTSTVLRNYSGTEVVGTTSGTMTPLHLIAYGIQMPTTGKKVRLDFMFRVQNAPTPSTWGFSLWSGDRSTSGTTTSATVTFRGQTGDIVVNPYANSRVYHGSFTTSAPIADDMLMILADNRAGALTSTVYMYATLAVYLVD